MPDIVVVLFDSSVRREESGFCNINQHLLCPCFSVCVISQCLIFLLNIIVEVKQCHKPVFAYQFVVQSFEIFFVAKCQHLFTYNEVNTFLDAFVIFINISGAVVSFLVMLDNFLTGFTEDIDVIFTNQFADLNISAIHSSQSNGTVQHELHVTCTTCLFGSQGDLLRNIACRE